MIGDLRGRQNVLNLGMFVMAETFSLMTVPKQKHLENLIRINCAIRRRARQQKRQDSAAATGLALPILGRSRCCVCVGIIFAAKGG